MGRPVGTGIQGTGVKGWSLSAGSAASDKQCFVSDPRVSCLLPGPVKPRQYSLQFAIEKIPQSLHSSGHLLYHVKEAPFF